MSKTTNVEKKDVTFKPKQMTTLSTLEHDYIQSKNADGDNLNGFKSKYYVNPRVNQDGVLIGEPMYVPLMTRGGRYIEVSVFNTKGNPAYMKQKIKTRPRPIIYLSQYPNDYKPATIQDTIDFYTRQVEKTIKAVARSKNSTQSDTRSDINSEYLNSDAFNRFMNQNLEKLLFISENVA